ncbi:exocyst complex component SEC3A-like isoform X1 [Oryza glaberrima]|uniref:exocyst complex component SEC3A-like isoform X1 n=1 Tax=Oryza glaberrima TaxID=4538 RepID=UPI00224C0115|nr:exocyst complex component SEC3A-like isoform X1 [Oryza glaberrima]XP_052136554.1 exocyst complex component SEC3A-like isoform X1 [Oryza glaberrima]XP_052136555.1 exocyst complex component SEC3A-like isoform X1 [Oryza glaberrima]
MARSSADDMELKRSCEAGILSKEKDRETVVMSMRVAKGRGVWGKAGKLASRHMAKPRVLAVTTKKKGQRTKAFVRVLKYSNGGVLEPAKVYKMKHLSKVEVVPNDPSGCTFLLGFDNLRSQSVSPPQWTMRNKDDRNRFLMCILNMCKEIYGAIPKVVGMDVVEMAMWAKDNTTVKVTQVSTKDGPIESLVGEADSQVAIQKDLVLQTEDEDTEALLDTYIMAIGEAEAFSERMKRELVALESANVYALMETETVIEEVLEGLEIASICVEDFDEWLGIFNVKLRHMREDIQSIEWRNNKLELQSDSNVALIDELDKMLVLLHIPPEYEASLTGGSFDEGNMVKNIEACEWLTSAIKNLEASNLDPIYVKLRAVREKRAEFVLLKCTFVRRASEFLRNYFPSLIDFMLNDKGNFSQRGQLQRPDHADMRYKCRTYARLLQFIKNLDKSCLMPLRKSYCHSLNLLIRREAREFSSELRAGSKASKSSTPLFEGPANANQSISITDTTADAYCKMITVFIPLLVDESSFFAHFMCFDVAALAPSDESDNNNPVAVSEPPGSSAKPINSSAELGVLNQFLQELLDGIQEDFYAIVDWAFKLDPLSCISMHGITDRYLSGQKAEVAGYVHVLLDDLETRISILFSRFVDDACYQIEKYERNVRQIGVVPYIPRFSQLAAHMEQYINGSRDLVDQAYTKIVTIMFVTLEKIAQVEPKYVDIVLLENYAAFQHSLYDLANVVPTLAKYYHQASEAYEQACSRHINLVIYIHFEKLFQFARKIEELMYNMSPEEIPFQVGMSKVDFRKMLKSSLSGLDKTINAMYRKLQKNITAEELLPSLWDKCKKEFLDKYATFLKLISKIYPSETVISVNEMKDTLASL